MADEIGARLREARMRAKIDINEVETRTKIRAKYLRAIENEEWGLLPGEIYVKSFLRTYGTYLGLDTRQLLDDYRRRYEHPSDHELRPLVPGGRDRERRSRRLRFPPWAAVAIVLAAVVGALAYIGSQTAKQGSTTPTVTQTGSTGAAGHRHHHAGAAAITAPTKHHKPAAVTPHQVRLALVATGPNPVYICVEDASGRALIPGEIFNAGQTIPLERAQKLLVTLGNASVKMAVNGRNVPVAPSATSIGFELTPGSQRTLPPSRQPSCKHG